MRSRGFWLPDGKKSEANVIKSRNADVEAMAVSAVEGKPLYGGDMLIKPLTMPRESAPRFTPTHMNRLPTW